MRTTLTIDPDVAAILKRRRKARGEPLRKIINDALRESLNKTADTAPSKKEPFRTKTADLGVCFLPNLDCAGEVLDFLDAQDAKQK